MIQAHRRSAHASAWIARRLDTKVRVVMSAVARMDTTQRGTVRLPVGAARHVPITCCPPHHVGLTLRVTQPAATDGVRATYALIANREAARLTEEIAPRLFEYLRSEK